MMSSLRVAIFLLVVGLPAMADPTLSDPRATPLIGRSVRLTVKVANGVGEKITFSYGLDTTYNKPAKTAIATNEDASVTITELIVGQTYHFKAGVEGGGAETSDATFDATFASPVLTGSPASSIVGQSAALNGVITANGTPGSYYFEYDPAPTTTGVAATFTQKTAPPLKAIEAAAIAKKVTASIAGLTRNIAYNYRLVFQDAGGTEIRSTIQSFTTNNVPKPVADSVTISAPGTVVVNVLKNDVDPDGPGDGPLLRDVGDPTHGTAGKKDSKVTYTSGADFRGFDRFSYTVQDVYGAVGTSTVTIFSPGLALSGSHGGLIKDASGNSVGYFRFYSNANGTFTGSVNIDGKKYSLAGVINSDGSYSGTASGAEGSVAVNFGLKQTTGAAELRVSLNGGEFTGQADFKETQGQRRADLAGRYTFQMAGGSGSGTSTGDGSTGNSGTTTTVAPVPGGTGWATVAVSDGGLASIKGKLSDGRAFSTNGVVTIGSGDPTLTFFDDPRSTRATGTLTLGATVTGSVRVVRGQSGDNRFGAGYDVSLTATGAPFQRPTSGERTLESAGGTMNIAFSGGDLTSTITRNLRVSPSDNVQVTDAGREDLSVKIERSTGRFQTSMNADSAGKKLKGSGVLIQGTTASGAGVFVGPTQSGKITISAGSAAAPSGGSGGNSGNGGGTGTGTGTGTGGSGTQLPGVGNVSIQ